MGFLREKTMTHSPVFSVLRFLTVAVLLVVYMTRSFPKWSELRYANIHSFSDLYGKPILCSSGVWAQGTWGIFWPLTWKRPERGSPGAQVSPFPLPSSPTITLSLPHLPPCCEGGGLTPAPSWAAALGGRCGGEGRRAGRARACLGFGTRSPRPLGLRRPGGWGSRLCSEAVCTRSRGPAARPAASPSRALSSTVFATMFSSSMGCSAAGPTGPRRRPG